MKSTRLHFVAASVGMMSLVGVSTSSAEGELTGSVSLDLNSHFISYGFDVWGGGDDTRYTFNPSVSLDYAINENWTFSSGFWLDVNSNATPEVETVETDVWVGLAYSSGIYTASATFQNWQYAGDSEEVLDLGLSMDVFLNPSLTFHKRLSAGASGGMNGTFLVGGVEHGFDVSEAFSVSVPVSVAFALSEFHTTETGYGFASIGLQGSYALADATSLNFGLTYYDTDSGVVGNAEDSFLTYNAGVSFSF